MKYILYARRSTDDEKQALSIESQVEELKRRFSDLDIVEVIEEDGSAFKAKNRPKFAAMFRKIESGKVQGIIAWHPDRLSRNPLDGAQVIYALDRGILKDLRFGSYYWCNSPDGKLMLSIALSHAKYQSEKLAVDVMRGMEKKCRMGHMPTKAVLGYRNVRTEDRGRRYIERDSERFDLVKRMWELLLTRAYTVPAILNKAREWGLTLPVTRKWPERPLTLCTLYKVFTNLFYTGSFEWHGEQYKGSHPPMITLAQFEEAQRILGARGKPRMRKHVFPFSGCLRCGECGAAITAEMKQRALKKEKRIATYTYFHCTGKKGPCSQRGCIREEDLAALLRPYVEAIHISPRVTEWLRDKLSRMTEEERKTEKQERETLRRKYENTTKAMQNLVSLYVSAENGDKSLLSEEEFKKQKADLMVHRDKAKQLLDENERCSDNALDRTIATFDFAKSALRHFDEGDIEAKRAILMGIGSNWTLLKGLVHTEAKWPLLKIKEGVAAERKLQTTLEPKLVALGSLTEPEINIWWPRSESN